MEPPMPMLNDRKKRPRPESSTRLRCHVVDDHCDALKHIHAAIRRRALPFASLAMMHFDAHPDLMVTPDMPAEICFSPRDLYQALGTAEGGIAEWILPMVFQGHLSKLWWIRPKWAHQFLDGNYRFCVGQVKETGILRVSSTAPYFVDDRLYCPEVHMQYCKPVDLRVSLDATEEETTTQADQPAGAGAATPSTVVTTELGMSSRDSRSEPQPLAKSRILSEGDAVQTDPHNGMASNSGGARDVDAGGSGRLCEDGAEKPKEESSVGYKTQSAGSSRMTGDTGAAASPGKDGRRTPWILDICLDYFTTENPFMVELESLVGKDRAALVRSFYERPLFRGAGTKLPHETQLEHERVFKQEVARLLDPTSTDGTTSAQTARMQLVQNEISDNREPTTVGSAYSAPGSPPAAGESGKRETEVAAGMRGLEPLTALFDQDSESDRSLAKRFATMLANMGPQERSVIAWVDHCACLPRHLATMEEISTAVSRAEGLLRSVMRDGAGGDWEGRPGVVTVARSEDDGYVPASDTAFVERRVLAMLERLFGDELEVLYDEGIESKVE